MEDQLLPILFGALLGIAYGAFGYLTNSETDESFDELKFARTVVVWSGAGIVAVIAGFNPTDVTAIGEYTAVTGGLGFVVDQLYAYATRENLVDGSEDTDGSFVGPNDIDPEDFEAAEDAVNRALELIDEHDIDTSNYNDFVSSLSDEFDYETAQKVWKELRKRKAIPSAE